VNYKRVAEKDGREVPWDQVVKGKFFSYPQIFGTLDAHRFPGESRMTGLTGFLRIISKGSRENRANPV
jgi:hypothetical protein